MTITDVDPAATGHGWLHRLSRRTSVVYLLVLLTAIPSVSLPAFSLGFVRDRHDRARASAGVAERLRDIAGLDRVRVATGAEMSSTQVHSAVVALRIPTSLLALVPKTAVADPVASAAATDAALAAVRAGAGGADASERSPLRAISILARSIGTGPTNLGELP